MKKRAVAYACATALLMTAGGTGTSQVSSRNRIMRAVDASQPTAVRGTAHPMARAQFDRGRTDTTKPLNATLTFRLSPTQQADMNLLLQQQQDRTSPSYHRWLTPEQYAARFGMSAADLAKITGWLQSQGLTVDGVSRDRNEISFSGSVGQVEYALKTQFHNYAINGEQHFANATELSFPAAFSSEVLSVRGLDDFHPKPRVQPMPRFTSNISGNHFLIPGDFAIIYNLPSNLDGSGVTIAVVGQTLVNHTDLANFRTAAGLPAATTSNFTTTTVPGTGTVQTCGGDESEADLDLEWSEGVAKNATINYVQAGIGTGADCNHRTKNVFDALQYAISNNIGRVISISYGNCEANLPGGFPLTMQQWAQQANAQGQTISGPAGDDGAADCESQNATSASHGLAVDVPASIPEVTGVGGTEFTGDAGACPSGTCPAGGAPADNPYWSGSSTLNSGPSALQYIPETTWNDSNSSGLATGGGGASTIFGKPSWQTGTGVPSDGKRDVPDIALNGSNVHDSYLLCSQDVFDSANPPVAHQSCANGFRAEDNQTLTAIGGTSAGAPTFAGIVALLNQATGSNGLGNVNPMLYALFANNSQNHVFHDITSGTNKVPCTSGTKNCPAGTTSIGFSAGAGYDQVTGLGSLDVSKLVTAWLASAPSADFALAGLVSNVSSHGTTGTSTVTVTALNGFAGTVDLTCASSDTSVQISCTLNPTSVDLSSNHIGTSQLSIATVADMRLPSGSRTRGLWFVASGGLFAVVLLSGLPSRRRRFGLLSLIVLAIVVTAVGCGGGSSSNQKQQSTGTPAGTYSIVITGTSGALSHTASVNLTVQ